MDELDLQIIRSLATNSRTPYRQIAELTRLSVAGVHKRVQALMASGVIDGYLLKVNPYFQGATPVVVLGVMSGKRPKEVLSALRDDEETFQVMVSGGNHVLIAGMLRGMSDLDIYVSKVSEIAGLQDVVVGFDSVSAKVAEVLENMDVKELTPSDLRMLSVLKKDPRIPLSDVAEQLGTTPKAVARRINNLTSTGWIAFSIRVNFQRSGDVISAIKVIIDPHRKETLDDALNSIPSSVLLQRLQFSNLPDLLYLILITKTQDQVKVIVEGLQDSESILEVVPNFVVQIEDMPSWVDRIVPNPPTEPLR